MSPWFLLFPVLPVSLVLALKKGDATLFLGGMLITAQALAPSFFDEAREPQGESLVDPYQYFASAFAFLLAHCKKGGATLFH
jgi:hypothetical protein